MMLTQAIGAGLLMYSVPKFAALVHKRESFSYNIHLTEEKLRRAVKREAYIYGLDVVVSEELSDKGEVAYYDFEQDVIVWTAGVFLTRKQANVYKSSFEDFIRIVLAYMGGYEATPEIKKEASNLSKIFFTKKHDELKREALGYGRKFVKRHSLLLRFKYEVLNLKKFISYKKGMIY